MEFNNIWKEFQKFFRPVLTPFAQIVITSYATRSAAVGQISDNQKTGGPLACEGKIKGKKIYPWHEIIFKRFVNCKLALLSRAMI